MSDDKRERKAIRTLGTPEFLGQLASGMIVAAVLHGEDPRPAILSAIRRRGFALPNDREIRNWIADVLEGQHLPKRKRGRPRKVGRPDQHRRAVEHAIEEGYRDWLDRFRRDRETAWLKLESLRLHQENPDASRRRKVYDTWLEDDYETPTGFVLHGRKTWEADLTARGARPCPPKLRGEKNTPRILALKATEMQYSAGWKAATDSPLTPSVVEKIVKLVRKRKRATRLGR